MGRHDKRLIGRHELLELPVAGPQVTRTNGTMPDPRRPAMSECAQVYPDGTQVDRKGIMRRISERLWR